MRNVIMLDILTSPKSLANGQMAANRDQGLRKGRYKNRDTGALTLTAHHVFDKRKAIFQSENGLRGEAAHCMIWHRPK